MNPSPVTTPPASPGSASQALPQLSTQLSTQQSAQLLQQARAQAHAKGRSISQELAALAGCDARNALQLMGQHFGWPVYKTADLLRTEPVLDRLPLAKAFKRHALLMRETHGRLLGVVDDPLDPDLHNWLADCAGEMPTMVLATKEDIHACLVKLEEKARATDSLGEMTQAHAGNSLPNAASPNEARSGKGSDAVAVLSLASVSETASPAVKLVNSILYDALKTGASDIHIESTPAGFAVKLRIDGVLDPTLVVNGVETAEHVVSRLKVLAELDISERRVPQDGSFMVHAFERDIDLRLSIMPSIHGEDAVIRVLDKQAMIEAHGALTLEALGFDDSSLETLRRLAREPYGMLLVTGPTGSGKTTTLYGALSEIHDGRSKIITIEDPVEYQLPGILQIPVNEKKGLTFARGLRSILRHDPDKIMVGEIRDTETAQIAVQSALTGHLVLTTVHANNVFDVLGRFTHLGIDPYSFVSALNGIWAQRLLRLNCPACSTLHQPSTQELHVLGLSEADVVDGIFTQGQGCGECRGTGYKGRRAIAEILLLSDEIRELIVDRAPIRSIKEAARRQGTRSLREAALQLARRGQTTLSEVNRVTLHA